MIYFISDTHFNHENIIKYCKRPFKSIKEMNETLIKNWNSVVKNDDTIYHLGDLALGNLDDFKEIAQRLNGNKILIRGNHDKWKVKDYESLGFKVLKNPPIELEEYKLILSHTPRPDKEIKDGYINVHGHIHNKVLNDLSYYPPESFDSKKHINISVDVTNFTPVSLDDIRKKAH